VSASGFCRARCRKKSIPTCGRSTTLCTILLEADKLERFLEKGIIEVAPLAFMRGRTLNDSFVILDEAQNTTSEQMKMFLTRLGFNSKAVITGDVTQIDLPIDPPLRSGRGD
jgi:phosphate starvation-inducible protein PhoH